jgi:hypothetical protein
MTARYAARTTVAPDRSRLEIERDLARFGATAFGYMRQGQVEAVLFEIGGRRVRLTLTLPDPHGREFTRTDTGQQRAATAARTAHEQAVKARWRALVLVVKAKLAAIEAGISDVETEFLANIMLPSGATVGQWVQPQLDEVYGSGGMPALLPGSQP